MESKQLLNDELNQMPEENEKLAYKASLMAFSISVIGQRIAAAKAAIDDAQLAANQEEKSSAGDKHETSRAMGHLQKDMLTGQLASHLKDLGSLHSVNINRIYGTPSAGACIQCTDVTFFIATGLGKQMVDGKMIIFLSPHAPLTHTLMRKKVNDTVLFNGVENSIVDIY